MELHAFGTRALLCTYVCNVPFIMLFVVIFQGSLNFHYFRGWMFVYQVSSSVLFSLSVAYMHVHVVKCIGRVYTLFT